MSSGKDETDGAVKERVKTQKKDPTLYKVVLLNDDYTTMEFVMHVLETLFQKSSAEAFRVMMQVHLNGSGIAGVYPWEVAETKVDALTSMARSATPAAMPRSRGVAASAARIRFSSRTPGSPFSGSLSSTTPSSAGR